MSNKIFPSAIKPIISKGYGQTRGGNIWRSQVQGGLPRQGRDVYYDAVPISVTLVLDRLARQVFWKFITTVDGGASSFQMDHDTGNGVEPHNVQITSTITEQTQDGINWVVSFTATAERTSVQDITEFDETLLELFDIYGNQLGPFLSLLEDFCTNPPFINQLPSPLP